MIADTITDAQITIDLLCGSCTVPVVVGGRMVVVTSISVVTKTKLVVKCAKISHYKTRQNAQLSQRDRAARCVSFGQKWKTGTGRQYFTDIIGQP